MTSFGPPPGNTHCDWCCTAVSWWHADYTPDNEALCPACWQEWISINRRLDAEDAARTAKELRS